jgi:hypothetical protein
LLIDAYQPDANFVSARRIEVATSPERLWEVLPELPVALRNTRWGSVGAIPLGVAALVRREHGITDNDFGRGPWTLREGAVLSRAFTIDRVDPGRELVLVGRHSLADFGTNFYVESIGFNRSRLTNITRARFKTSVAGRVYLIGVHVFHNLYMDWMLRALRRRAEMEKSAAA